MAGHFSLFNAVQPKMMANFEHFASASRSQDTTLHRSRRSALILTSSSAAMLSLLRS